MGPRPRGRGILRGAEVLKTVKKASMGPRPRGRGIPQEPQTENRTGICFNGATTSRSWNPGCRTSQRVGKGPLQWGHDLAVVESPVVALALETVRHASMGPRPRGRGILNSLSASELFRTLQWGHDLAVVESGEPQSPRARATRFNGATTSRSWNHSSQRRAPTRFSASMGPRPRGRGIIR